ncbi:Uma2 family endonuclease [Nocardia stercoris]|nr:Uma2 family endonuclease [Nocardia stercoris]
MTVRHRRDPWRSAVADRLFAALSEVQRAPYAVLACQCVLLDEHNPAVPDVVVVNRAAVDLYAAEVLPADAAVLVVEIVSAGDRSDRWYRTPSRYAAAGIAYFWRVERGLDGRPIVYEYWLDHESRRYRPAPAYAHTGVLATTVPFPIRVDLADLLAGPDSNHP